MRINPQNLSIPTQTPYGFCDGELHSDPKALTTYFGSMSRRLRPSDQLKCDSRNLQKAHRLQRLAAKARKDRQRRGDL